MQKFTTVIFLSPEIADLSIDNERLPRFMLPIMNEDLLDLNIKWARPISNKIHIVAVDAISEFLNKYKDFEDIDLHVIDGFCGTYNVLNQLKNLLGDDIIIIKSDIFCFIPITQLIKFYDPHSKFLAIVRENNKSGDVFGISKQKLCFYQKKSFKMPLFKNKIFKKYNPINFRSDLELMQFFVIHKSLIFEELDGKSFSKEIFSSLVKICEKNRPMNIHILPYDKIFQINSVATYTDVNCLSKLERSFPVYTVDTQEICSEYRSRQRVSFAGIKDEKKTIVGPNFLPAKNLNIVNTIIGSNVKINANTSIMNSIIMDNVAIEEDCMIDGCIISHNVEIYEKTTLKDCCVPEGYIFLEPTYAESKNFKHKSSKNDDSSDSEESFDADDMFVFTEKSDSSIEF